MKRFGFGALFVSWFYGVPFVLVVGLVRRASRPYLPTYEAARAFGATTDALLRTAFVLNAVLPLAGVVLARLVRDRYWLRHFGWAVVGALVIYFAISVVAAQASTALVGHVPAYPEPTHQEISHCVARSGGHGCPGG
jgi:hypothetical protein